MREKICGAQLVLTKRVSQLTVPAETENTSRRQRPLQLSMQRRIAVTPSIQLRSEQTTFDQQTARHLVARAMLRDQEPARPLHVWSSLSRYSFPGFKAVGKDDIRGRPRRRAPPVCLSVWALLACL